jgi:putative transposase
MASKSVATLLSDLGVTKTHSRPYTSNDNPYSEAQFKTPKYRPGRERVTGSEFFRRYHFEHWHSGIGLMTPADVHNGYGEVTRSARAHVLRRTYRDHPQRFVNKIPEPPELAKAVWINRPRELGLAG